MNILPIWEREITYPDLLTPNALKIAKGKPAANITEADWESYHRYCERVEAVDRIVAGVFTHFGFTGTNH